MVCGQVEVSPVGCLAGPAAQDAHLAVGTMAAGVQKGPGWGKGVGRSAHSRRPAPLCLKYSTDTGRVQPAVEKEREGFRPPLYPLFRFGGAYFMPFS